MAGSSQQSRIAVIVKGYPRLSETFIAQEILALEKYGLRMSIISLRLPTDTATHPIHKSISAPVVYLPEYLYRQPGRVWRAWRRARRMAGYGSACKAWVADLRKDRTANRVRRFGQALVLAAELPADTGYLYAHFLHTPASVARYTSLITGVPWSCSAHAKDIWTTPNWEITQKLSECEWLVSCTAANVAHLKNLAPDPSKVSLAYHGLDFDRFRDPADGAISGARNGAAAPLGILSIGRAVAKKGLDDLLRALARIPAKIDWRLVHIGGGALTGQLMRLAGNLGIADRIEWRGPRPFDQVLRAYREADIFVLPSRVADDGDRDGLPNVLLEAQSQKLPCISTRVSGIPELVDQGVTGLLVEQKNPAALARAIQQLLLDAGLRERLGQAGFERVRSTYSMHDGIEHIIQRFPASLTADENRILRTT